MNASVMPPVPETMDITPSPRILWVLGQIPFLPWQAFAELIDNSLDAFQTAERLGMLEEGARIDISWSPGSVASSKREIVISDNGFGVSLETINRAVRAGYTSNDPVSKLGLFGMGFNIATARLGGVTRFLSSVSGQDPQWEGIEINFRDLQDRQSFDAPVIREEKDEPGLTGTRIVIGEVTESVYKELKDQDIRRMLEDIYSPILRERNVSIFVNGVKLEARPYCVWGSDRSVMRSGEEIHAVITIDRDLGPALFDNDSNRYLSGSDEFELRRLVAAGRSLPTNIIERSRRLTGWIGIQRYFDPNDFGIDFVRNGRKIILKDKSLFSWKNQFTGESILEYPMEMGTTTGGRIIGEIHADYLVPTYQKNGFDVEDPAWAATIAVLRGDGPLLPKRRKEFTSAPAVSPIAILVNSFRRTEAGSRNLAVPPTKAREWRPLFYKGDASLADDSRWWKAVQEVDQTKADGTSPPQTPVNDGSTPSDDVDDYGPVDPSPTSGPSGVVIVPEDVSLPLPPGKPTAKKQDAIQEDTSFDSLLQASSRDEILSGDYAAGRSGVVKVSAYSCDKGVSIFRDAKKVPCVVRSDGNGMDFFYDREHPLISEHSIEPRDLVTIYVAEKIKARDNAGDIVSVFGGIYGQKFNGERLVKTVIQERAAFLLEEVKEKFVSALDSVSQGVVDLIHEASGEVEEIIPHILGDAELLGLFQAKDPKAITVIEVVPGRTLVRILEKFPAALMDDIVFARPFKNIKVQDDKVTERMRTLSKKHLLSWLEDVVYFSELKQSASKDELRRGRYSLSLLADSLV